MSRGWAQLKPLLKMNWALLAATVALTVAGVLFVYSACYVSESEPVRRLYVQQMYWALAGLAASFALALFDYRRWIRHTPWFYGLSLFLLVFVLVFGIEIYGARRWLRLFGAMGIQPSEFAKLALVGVLAFVLGRPGEDATGWKAVVATFSLAAAPVALVFLQPDLGTAIVFFAIAGAMLFAAGVRWRIAGALLAVGLLLAGFALGAMAFPERLGPLRAPAEQTLRVVGVRDYHRERLAGFFNADKDPLGSGWNKIQSRIAIGSGGVRGKGYLKGTQNMLGYLPRTVAPTDFIFSVIAEEIGFVGAVAVLFLFATVIVSGMRAALATEDKQGQLLCAGLIAMLFGHVAVNVAMTVGLIPITGLPLPFLSYGGSFMIATLSAVGIIQSVHVRARREAGFTVD